MMAAILSAGKDRIMATVFKDNWNTRLVPFWGIAKIFLFKALAEPIQAFMRWDRSRIVICQMDLPNGNCR
jgi:hypothetical protein